MGKMISSCAVTGFRRTAVDDWAPYTTHGAFFCRSGPCPRKPEHSGIKAIKTLYITVIKPVFFNKISVSRNRYQPTAAVSSVICW